MSIYDFKNLTPEQRAVNKTIAIIENSARHAANLQAAENAALEKQKRDAELQAEAEKHLAERQKELRAEEEKRRKEANKNLEVELRERFFRANPNALESDYLRVKVRLKDEYFLQRTKSESTGEDLMRNSGSYGAM